MASASGRGTAGWFSGCTGLGPTPKPRRCSLGHGRRASASSPTRTRAPAAAQWAARYALLDTLNPAELAVPSRLEPLMSAGFGGNSDRQTDIEIIQTAGGPIFDPLKATEIGAVQTLNALLNPDRL